MRLYYRADTRSPKTIFQDGFQSKNNFLNLYGDSWWQQGVRSANDRYSTSPKKAATDADMNNVVCLAKKLESAPLFPVCDKYHVDYDSEIYIYVMALADAELPQDFNTPQPIDVFDMEALQVQQLEKIMSDFSVNPAMAGYVLSGHEVFAKNVPAQNIICAVKCKRSDFSLTAGLPVFTKAADDAASYAVCQEFEIGHEVFVNRNYIQDEQHKEAALDELRQVKAKGLQPTARVPDALDQCGIGYDKRQIHTSTYFWQELTSLNFGIAFFSILESIYYAAIQLTKAMGFYGRYFTTVGVVTGQVDPMTAFAITHL